MGDNLESHFEPDFEKYKQDLLRFVGSVELVERHMATCQQTFDDMLEASLDLAEKVGPKWKDELRVLIPALQSLQRRSRVMNAAVERFLKKVE